MGQGRAGPAEGACGFKRRTWLAPCGLCCAGALGLLHVRSQPARGWLAPCLGCALASPAADALPILIRLAASAPAGARPAHTPCALRSVVDVLMPVHATIIRGRRHLHVALEIFNSSSLSTSVHSNTRRAQFF